MGRLTSRHNQFCGYQHNWSVSDGVGATITPGTSNAKGSWVDLFGGTVSDDSFGVWLAFHDSTGSGNDILADIGVDVSGGTSYSVLIPNLIAGYCTGFSTNTTGPFGHCYYFPLFIPAGARIGCRAQTSLATAVAVKLRSRLFQKPSHPELVKCGDFVDAVGVNTGTSRGTVIAAGGRVQGSYGSLGTAPRDAFYFEKGCAMVATVASNNFVDFAVGNPQRNLVSRMKLGCVSGVIAEEYIPSRFRYATIPAGAALYARAESDDSTPDTFYAAMYLVGGLGRS